MPQDFYQISLKAILKDEDGRILGLKGKVGGSYEGFYDLPGGRIDESEFTTPYLEILSREINEETGLKNFKLNPQPVAIGRHALKAGTPNEIHVLYIFFEGTIEDTHLATSDEHDGHDWLETNSDNLKAYFISGILEGMRGYLKK